MRPSGQTKDITFMWVLEEWRSLAEEWLKTKVRRKARAMNTISSFFQKYLVTHNITKSPKDFLVKGYPAPDFYEIGYSHRKSQSNSVNQAKKTVEFIDWVLFEKFSFEDDFENKQSPAEFHNPLTKYIPDYVDGSSLNESNKNVLPYRYIKDLRPIICPINATRFKDWIFGQEATDGKNGKGDCFAVDESLIDANGPDCVFRKRKTSKYERDTKGFPEMVYELWSPVVSVALLSKLLLPIRTYQIRMLDSGEMDTYKYIQQERVNPGKWIINDSPLSKGDKDNPFEKGVLRKFNDPTSKMEMTGFYINTNKTADINKDEGQKFNNK